MTRLNHCLKVLTIIVFVLFSGYFLELYGRESVLVSDYFEILSDFVPTVLSYSIFVMAWFSYRKNKDSHSLFLGMIFFVIGNLGLYHMLSYPYMPDFITPNSHQKEAIFEFELWLISSLLFFISVYIYKDSLQRLINRTILAAFAIALSLASLFTVLFYFDNIPVINYTDNSISTTGIFMLLINIGVMAYTTYLYVIRFRKTGEKNLICLTYGFTIIVFSNVAQIFYVYAGNLLQAVGFYFVYLSLFRASVEQHYESLVQVHDELRYMAEDRYRNLIDNASDAILIHDSEDKIISWNHGAEKIFGWKTEEVIGKKISQLIIPPNKQDEADQMDQDALHGKVITGIDKEYIRKNGSKIDVNITISPIRNANKNIIGLSSIIRDITERKRAERLKLANIELINAEKLKSQFLSVVSHELKTPLTSMKAQLQMVLAGYFGDVTEKQKNSLEMVLRNATRQDRLIGDILDISKLEAGVMKYAMSKNSLNICVENIVEMMGLQARDKNITLTFKEDTIPETILDKDRITQVVVNLINNAIKFTNIGGTIDVELSDNTDSATFKIKDNGIGIGKDDQERIFKPFEQVDSGNAQKSEGSGLGLTICNGIITQHGGKLWVESELGKGTTFQFTIPYNNKIKEEQVKLDLLVNESSNEGYE